MKLKKFIQKLKEIEVSQGSDIEVVMADYIPVVKPIFDQFYGRKVIITDQLSGFKNLS